LAVYLPKYRADDGTIRVSKVYWMDFNFHGQPIRESTRESLHKSATGLIVE
jgi:hypothetical protein